MNEQIMMRQFCESLPDDRILGNNANDLNDLLDDNTKKRQYSIPKTGACLTYHSALTVLARYASSLVYLSSSLDIFESLIC
jgi:endoribonuclease Dicer